MCFLTVEITTKKYIVNREHNPNPKLYANFKYPSTYTPSSWWQKTHRLSPVAKCTQWEGLVSRAVQPTNYCETKRESHKPYFKEFPSENGQAYNLTLKVAPQVEEMRYVECFCSLNNAASYILKELFCFTTETDAVSSCRAFQPLLTSKCPLDSGTGKTTSWKQGQAAGFLYW